jgi:hypothetical protein
MVVPSLIVETPSQRILGAGEYGDDNEDMAI